MDSTLVPSEIFSLILDYYEKAHRDVDSSILHMFQTCPAFYLHVRQFHCRHVVIYNASFLTKHNNLVTLLGGLLEVPNKNYDDKFIERVSKNIYNVENYDNNIYLPDHICRITFNTRVVESIDFRNFSQLTHITFGDDFNSSLDYLPPRLTHLTLGYCFDQPVDNLPNTLAHLVFGSHFTQNVDKLPKSLVHLVLGRDFDQPIDKLPTCLRYIKFGFYFNHSVDMLPDSLNDIIFGCKFNKSVDKLPPNLIRVVFGRHFNQSIGKLPASVKYLSLDKNFDQQVDVFPPSLTHLTLRHNMLNYADEAPFLTHITLDIHSNKTDIVPIFPSPSVTYLALGSCFKGKFMLPRDCKITHLSLDKSYPHTIPLSDLPLSLKIITIDDRIITIPR